MTATRIANVRGATDEEWDAAWRASAHATFFESRQWAEAWARSTADRMHPDARRIEFADGQAAVVPSTLDSRLRGVASLRRMSAGDTYGGWLCDSELTKGQAEAILDWTTNQPGSFRWLVNPFLAESLGGEYFQGAGTTTLALDLSTGFEACRSKWSKGHRSAAAKARREGVKVTVASTQAEWREYFRTYEASLARWGRRVTSKYDWRLFGELLQEPRDVRLWLATVDGSVAAGALCLYSDQTVAYWHGAARAEYFHLGPTNLVLHEVIRDACDRGARWFDLGPSGGHEGVERFKRGFSPARLTVPVIDRSTPPVALARWLRRQIRAGRNRFTLSR